MGLGRGWNTIRIGLDRQITGRESYKMDCEVKYWIKNVTER